MHTHDLSKWRHEHVFDTGNSAGERGTRWVMWITAVMMVAEIAAGWFYNSMALLADGFHMSSHAVAIGLSAFAYAAARKHANVSTTVAPMRCLANRSCQSSVSRAALRLASGRSVVPRVVRHAHC